MTEVQMVVIAGAFIVAGIAKGAIGIGLPPIAIGLMTLALPLGDALAIMTIPTITTNIFQAFYGGRLLALLRRFGTMAGAAVVGVIAAAVTLGKLGSAGTIGWLGLLMVLYSLLALFAWRPVMPRAAEPWANPVIGLASGAVAGLTGMAAVPFLPYMQSLQITKNDLIQGLGILFLFITGALAVALVQQNIFDTANTIGGVAAIAPTFLGVWIGQKVRHAASPETFRKIFLYGMLALGLHMARGLL
ncbi:MAG: sulfite exporter TauE/SafE family protein [Reyranella sp.]|nr:sulfite exporter TauE/SafE family protein [Reyranella sp.]MDP3160357.1 sulfite exporter TauE/SafE family protein [Reyranella sp.]